MATTGVHMAKFDALLVKGGVRSDAQVIAAFKCGRAVGGLPSLGSL